MPRFYLTSKQQSYFLETQTDQNLNTKIATFSLKTKKPCSLQTSIPSRFIRCHMNLDMKNEEYKALSRKEREMVHIRKASSLVLSSLKYRGNTSFVSLNPTDKNRLVSPSNLTIYSKK
jgi:hypothetical protein